MNSLKTMVMDFFSRGSDRSVKARKNAAAMVFLKGGNILIGLLLVPLTLHYVDQDTYGVWLALSSMVAWMSFFDIGLNNGLKNRLTEALAAGDKALGRRYVSTTYAILSMIFIPLMAVMLAVSGHIDWVSLLNLPDSQASGLVTAACIIIAYFCINFILSTLNVIIMAEQRPADSSLISFIQQATSLAVIYILTLTTKGSLTNLCIGLCASPLAVIAVSTAVFFSGRYKDIAPSASEVDMTLAPSLLKLGVQFFIIQIAAIVQFQMLNFLIIRYYGAADVASYNIAYKYFNVPFLFWGIITTPIWAAVTDSIALGDYGWIRRTIRDYLRILVLFIAGSVVMLLISGPVYHIWVGDKVAVPFMTSLWVMVYNCVMMFTTLFVTVVNGSGDLRIQTVSSCISPFVFLGLCWALISMGVGVHAIMIAAIVSNFNGYLLAPLQCRKMLRRAES